MSAKEVKCNVVLLFVVSSFISAAWGYTNLEFRPNFSYRSADNYHRSVETTPECVPASVGPKGPAGDVTTAAPPPAANGGTVAGTNGGTNGGTNASAPLTTATATQAPGAGAPGSGDMVGGGVPTDSPQSASALKLRQLVQHIYAAQGRVQLEANEIKKAQGVATSAQKTLEEAANNVRVITSALQTAQQEVAAAAVRAQTAQLQLAAHDQLLFAARQKVDALSAQMVGLQAEDGINAPKTSVNIQQLLAQLKEPLPMSQVPTSIPPVDNPPNDIKGRDAKGLLGYDYYYTDF